MVVGAIATILKSWVGSVWSKQGSKFKLVKSAMQR